MFTKKVRLISFCLFLSMILSGVAGIASAETTQLAPIASSNAQAGISQTTGLPTTRTYQPVLVMIENSAQARPHLNMSEADIVYEMIYWGPSHTRYMAVYNDAIPSVVGSIRSARIAYCELRQEWDAPLVFYGGQDMEGTSIYDFFSQYNVTQAFRFDGVAKNRYDVFSRTTERQNPHNALADLTKVIENWPTNEDGSAYQPRDHAYIFSDTPTQGADSAREVHVIYDQSEYYPAYTYNETDRVYERWYNGQEQYDGQTGKRIVASNVIVQFCDISFYNGSRQRPVVTTIGSGVMDAFIDGKHIRGSWVRDGMNERTRFVDQNGDEITLLTGKTFIQIIPKSSSFSYIRNDGSEIKLDFGAPVAAPEFDLTEPDDDINKMDEGEGNG